MRKPLYSFLLFIVLAVSCIDSPIRQNQSIYEQITLQLRKAGYLAEYIPDRNVLLISSSLNLNDMALMLNGIFDDIGHSERKFIFGNTSSNAKTQRISCEQSEIFYESGGATCVNYFCVADLSFSNLSFFDCFSMKIVMQLSLIVG